MSIRLAAGIGMVLSTLAFGTQSSIAAPAYMNDADTRKPSNSARVPSINGHKFPRVIMAETQSMAGDLDKFAKYQVVTAGGGVLNKIAKLQKKNSSLLFFRALMPTEYLGYTHSNVHCSHSHSLPFENTTSSTSGCGVYAGHWLYQAGTKTKKSINSSTSTIPVADAKRFQVGQYIVIYSAPAGSFKNAEHAKITGRNTSKNTLTVQRGFKSKKRSHGSGSIVAQHVTGQGGSSLNWSFNISTTCPKDSNGKTYAQAAIAFIKGNYAKDWQGYNTSAKVSGFLFDSDFYTLFTNKRADVNNDLKTDDGKSSSGYNYWGNGLERFYQSVRSAFPNMYIKSGHQLARAFNSTNGTQMEGWPQSNGFHSVVPQYKTLNSEFANYRYYMHYINQGPAATHVLTKTPTSIYPKGTGASSNKPFRFALGMGLLEDGYFGSQNSTNHPDVWYDEFSVITDKSSGSYGKAVNPKSSNEATIRKNTGWLGNPLGSYTRIYNQGAFSPSASLISPGTFDSNTRGWSGVNVNISRDTSSTRDGAGSLRISKHTRYQSKLYGAKVKGPSAGLSKNGWYTLVFSAKADSPREIKANVGGYGERFLVGKTWRRYVMAFQAPASGSQRIDFTVGDENTNVWLDTVHLFKGNPNVFRRDFQNGIVVVNGTGSSTNVNLGGTFQHILGTQDRSVNNGKSVKSVSLKPWDAVLLVRSKKGGSSLGNTSPSTTPDTTPTDPSDVNVCGAPSVATDSDQGLFIWKNCNAGSWHMVASAGGDSGGIVYRGTLSSGDGFNMIDPVGFESHDVLDMGSTEVGFTLKVWNKGTDGIDLVVPETSEACFKVNASAGVYIGRNKVEMPSAFDLNTLKSCN